MPDILLVQPPIRDFYLTTKRTIPYGLASIAAACESAGFTVGILDALATSRQRNLEWPQEMDYLKPFYGREDRSPFALFHRYRHHGYSLEHIGRMAKKSGAFLIGISSLFTPYSREALETADRIKSAHPACRIVLGGHHPTEMPQQVMQCPSVDFVIRGDGEKALPLLAAAMKRGQGPEDIPGIVYRGKNGEVTASEPHRLDRLSGMPLPATHLICHPFYRRGKKNSAVIVASRGCPGRCSYCCMRRSPERPYVRRSIASVLAEVERAVRRDDAGFIDFEDENLSLDRPWFLALMHQLIMRFDGAGLELRAMNGLFPPSLDNEVVAAMAAAGFKALNLSLGSSCPAQLRRFRRPDVRETFDSSIAAAQKYGLQAVGYILAGAPGQSAESSVADLLYLAQRRVLTGISIYYPAPGSPDYQRCRELGLLPQSLALMRSSTLPIDHTTSRLQAATLLRLGRISNFMKSLLDQKRCIPAARPFTPGKSLDPGDRMAAGLKLLEWFQHDGEIRGISPDGKVYRHNIDSALSRKFLEGLGKITLQGCR